MGSILSAGKVPGFIFRPLSSGPMSCPSQQSEKYSSWTLTPPLPCAASAVLSPLHGPISSVSVTSNSTRAFSSRGVCHWAHGDQRCCSFPGKPSSREWPEDPETIQPDVLVSPRKDKSLAFRHTLWSFNRGSLTRGLVSVVAKPQESETIQCRMLSQSLELEGQGTRWSHQSPEARWLMRARTREGLQPLGSVYCPSHREGRIPWLLSSPPLPPAIVSSHRPDPRRRQRAGKWGNAALHGDTEQSRGSAGAGAESQQTGTAIHMPQVSVTLLPSHPGDQSSKAFQEPSRSEGGWL